MLITVTELRRHVTTRLGDEALLDIIEAEEQEIERRVGPLGTITDVRHPRNGETVILLGRIPESIVSVTERIDTLDYPLEPEVSNSDELGDYYADRGTLRRTTFGPNPSDGTWGQRVTIVYVPKDDAAKRKLALIKLCALDAKEQDAGAVVSRTVGASSVTYATPQARTEERELILAELEIAQTPLFA